MTIWVNYESRLLCCERSIHSDSRAQSFYFSTQHYRSYNTTQQYQAHTRASTYNKQVFTVKAIERVRRACGRPTRRWRRDIACVCCRHRSAAQIFLSIYTVEWAKPHISTTRTLVMIYKKKKKKNGTTYYIKFVIFVLLCWYTSARIIAVPAAALTHVWANWRWCW